MRTSKSLLIFVVLIFLIPFGTPHLSKLIAQEAEDDSRELTAVMQAYLSNQQPVTSLQKAMAASPCVGGLAASTYPCQNVDLLSFMPLSSIGNDEANDIWGWTDPQDGDEYALIGLRDRTSFIDISDPENPVYLGFLSTHTSSSNWRDIKVYANHAFIVSEASGHGMQVFDLTRLRNVSSPPQSFNNDAHFSGFGNAHNIVINEDSGFAYGVGTSTCSGGLHMVNIQNPTSPTDAGCFSSDGYTHDAQCVIYNGPDLAHIGKEICFNSNEETITIVDVTNKNAPVQLSRTGYTGCTGRSNCYTHKGWLTEDQTTFLLDDELDETRQGINTRTYIWDVSDLDNPVHTGSFNSANPSIDHNQYVKGKLVYQANYTAGLRILEVGSSTLRRPATLSEVAYFDIYPANNNASFNAMWSNYPYFDSDVVIMSGIEQGLFVVKPTNMDADFSFTPNEVALEICGSGSDTAGFSFDDIYGFDDTVSLSIVGVPAGAASSFSANPAAVPGNSTLTITNSSAATGSYLLTVTAVSPDNVSYDEYLKLDIVAGVTTPSLTSPADGQTAVSLPPTLTWNSVNQATSYDIQIATDAGFSNVVESATITTNSYMATGLAGETTYYWRVRAKNGCDTSSYSAADSFTTAEAPASSPTCNGTAVGFESGIPADWVVINQGNDSIFWTTTTDSNCNHANQTPGGDGETACIDSDEIGGTNANDVNSYLCTPALDLDGVAAADFNFDFFWDNGVFQQEINEFEVVISSGSPSGPYTQLRNYIANGSDPSIAESISLNAYTNQSQLYVCFHYESGWNWEVEVDDVGLSCSCSAPGAVTDATISIEGDDIELDWSPVANVNEYEIHRVDSQVYYTPSGATRLGKTKNSDFLDSTGLASNYSYVIIARNGCGETASLFNRTGVFSFEVKPGS
ncbi:MAG: choice-of-anchor B family protein [Chloroflexota bacterium]